MQKKEKKKNNNMETRWEYYVTNVLYVMNLNNDVWIVT